MFNKFPKRTGTYHIRDNIERLELQLRLRHVNSLLELPKYELNRNALHKDANAAARKEQNDDTKVTRIRWQQKLLSPSEVELYQELVNCATDTQKKYHRWLTTTDDKGAEGAMPKPDENTKAKKRSKKQSKAKEPKLNDFQSTNEIFTFVQEDNFKPLTKEPNQRNVTNTEEPAEMMYIYAALNPDTQLVSLRWQPRQRMLHIYPDFNSLQDNPYFIEIDTDYRHLYAYAFENTSERFPSEASNGEEFIAAANFLLPTVMTTHWNAEHDLAAQFAMPPKRTVRISLLFEIREARNFEYDNLHVRYHIHLPSNTLHEEGQLEASTHSSAIGHTSGHHFGYAWQLTLLCEECFNPYDRMHIYFELISIDSWGRERIDGYAHHAVFLGTNTTTTPRDSAGPVVVRLQCLRPADGFWDAISRHFIGGRRQFDFVRFFSAADSTEFHSRYRCRMQSTGELLLSCQRLSQSNCELLVQPCRTTGMTLDDIMLAYREARRRLEAVVLQ